MDASDSDSSSSGSLRYPHDTTFGKMVESGQIGFRLAEEIKSLREELLVVKQEKRILLVSNENLEDALSNANKMITEMHCQMIDLQNRVKFADSELTKKEKAINIDQDAIHQLNKQLSAEKKKNRLLGEELERSLEDEVTLRTYSRRLEQDVTSAKEISSAATDLGKREIDERLKCELFIDKSLRSQLIFQKKLEMVVYYCDKDVDISGVSIADASSDYVENLLRDIRSDSMNSTLSTGGERKMDFSILEQKQNRIDYQLNQYLSQMRAHLSKYRHNQAKSRKHVRSLLEVVRTYEDLPSTSTYVASVPAQQYIYDSLLDQEVSLYGHRSSHRARLDVAEPPPRDHIRHSNNEDLNRSLSQYRMKQRCEENTDFNDMKVNQGVGGRELGTEILPIGERKEHSSMSASAPPSRHHHFGENSPSPLRAGMSPPRRRVEESSHSSRTLKLLQQLQKEMLCELRG